MGMRFELARMYKVGCSIDINHGSVSPVDGEAASSLPSETYSKEGMRLFAHDIPYIR